MFGLFKSKSTSPADYSSLKVDMHSHLVPGVDDGSPDMETSISFIKEYAALGYKKIITTPHILWDLYRNEPDVIRQKAEQVRMELRRQEIDIEFHAAAEYFMDEHFDQLLASDVPLLTLKDNLLLVEFSFMSQPMDLKDKIFAIQMKGYQPVLAHPERYPYFIPKKHILHELKDAGCLLQMNILSLKGYYGKPIMDQAQYLLKNQLIDLIGTDLHHERHMALLKSPELAQKVNEVVRNHNIINPTLL